MIRLRFTGKVPDHSVNVAYTEGKDLSVPGCVSLLDMGHRRPENLSSYVGGELDLNVGSDYVDTKKILISPRSVLSPNVRRPIPLYYGYVIGHGTYGVAIPTFTANLYLAKIEILKTIRLLGRDDAKISDVDWDVDITGYDPSGLGYTVKLLLSWRQARHETYKIQYQAVRSSDGASFPNHIEVVNPVPLLEEGTDYTLVTGSQGYVITGLDPATNHAEGLGIFSLHTSALTVAVNRSSGLGDPDRVQLSDSGGTPVNFPFSPPAGSELSIQELVNSINEHPIISALYKAVALSDNKVCRLTNTSFSLGAKEGRALRQLHHARIRYDDEVQVRCMAPYADPDSLPWYPRVSYGEFSQSAWYRGSWHKFVFRPLGDSVLMPGGRDADKYERVDEKPHILGPKMLRLRRPGVDPSSIKLYRGEKELTGLLLDYDQLNSVLFLSQEVGDIQALFASYQYTEDSFIYTGVDLNPLAGHSPDLYGRYVGLYMTPATIMGSSGTVEFTRTIYHTIADDIPSIIRNVDLVRIGIDSAKAILLGIYRVGQPATIDEVKLTDTRSRGGGIRESVDPMGVMRAEEARMFMDISMWDGEPFPPAAVIVSHPSEILGTGEPPMHRDPTADVSGFFYPSGLLDPETIQNKLDRYKAAGVIMLPDPEDELNG